MEGIGNDFVGLPMDALIGAPLDAACKAQFKLGTTMIDFIKMLSYDNGKDGKTRTLSFEINRPVIDKATGESKGLQPVKLDPPVLGLVPVPALLVEDVTIDFEMEVKSSVKDTSETSASITAQASGGFWGQTYSISGTVSTKAENTRSTDKSAKYTVHVEARQQPMPEGLAKLIQTMASAAEPYPVGK